MKSWLKSNNNNNTKLNYPWGEELKCNNGGGGGNNNNNNNKTVTLTCHGMFQTGKRYLLCVHMEMS